MQVSLTSNIFIHHKKTRHQSVTIITAFNSVYYVPTCRTNTLSYLSPPLICL